MNDLQVQKVLPKDCLIINEGSNTMDIGRTMMPNNLPRHRSVLSLKLTSDSFVVLAVCEHWLVSFNVIT